MVQLLYFLYNYCQSYGIALDELHNALTIFPSLRGSLFSLELIAAPFSTGLSSVWDHSKAVNGFCVWHVQVWMYWVQYIICFYETFQTVFLSTVCLKINDFMPSCFPYLVLDSLLPFTLSFVVCPFSNVFCFFFLCKSLINWILLLCFVCWCVHLLMHVCEWWMGMGTHVCWLVLCQLDTR